MVESTWARAAHRFHTWYGRTPDDEFWYPPRLRNREWMFIGWGPKPPDRHRGFDKRAELMAHIRRAAPHSCFYSTAYYDEPSARKMVDKGWNGADLIFDLDGDHLSEVDPFDFPSMLDTIQVQAHKLWHDFLHPEFGFEEQYLQLTFSGHRGFHLHYREPTFWQLDSSARRELVSHIRGLGADVSVLRNGPDCGWKRRIENGIGVMLEQLDVAAQDDTDGRRMIKHLVSIVNERGSASSGRQRKVGPQKMLSLATKVQHPERRERIVAGNTKGLKNHETLFLDLVKGDNSIILSASGETDEAVTLDIKRVIRWPTGLHGKSGLQVTEFPLSRLDPNEEGRFDALSEAVPRFDDRRGTLEVTVERAVARVGDEELELELGDHVEVGANMETFLTLKGWARPIRVQQS